jgi:hypothetical protein
MLLEKVRSTLGPAPYAEIAEVAHEALLYGMRINRTPHRLKALLKQHRLDTSGVSSSWAGTYYLLNELPRCLRDQKRKIPCLVDFLFARAVLSESQMQQVFRLVDNLPDLTPAELLKDLMPQIKRGAYRGRFLSLCDDAYETADIQQDLITKALTIMNREWGNLKSHAREDIHKYIGFCFDSKTNTYLSSQAPEAFKKHIEEPDDLERQLEENTEEQVRGLSQLDRDDLARILTAPQLRAVLILLGEADEQEMSAFRAFLKQQGRDDLGLKDITLKRFIEQYCGEPVWDTLKESSQLAEYLRT